MALYLMIFSVVVCVNEDLQLDLAKSRPDQFAFLSGPDHRHSLPKLQTRPSHVTQTALRSGKISARSTYSMYWSFAGRYSTFEPLNGLLITIKKIWNAFLRQKQNASRIQTRALAARAQLHQEYPYPGARNVCRPDCRTPPTCLSLALATVPSLFYSQPVQIFFHSTVVRKYSVPGLS